MSYTELISTMTISSDVPTTVNENFRSTHFLNDAAKTTSFTAWTDDTAGHPIDVYLCASAGGNVTVTLPAVASGDANIGRVVTIFKVDAANDVIIDANASETINGATTVTMSSQYNYRTIFSNGTEWFVISSS
jgi:hypothetical protein